MRALDSELSHKSTNMVTNSMVASFGSSGSMPLRARNHSLTSSGVDVLGVNGVADLEHSVPPDNYGFSGFAKKKIGLL